MKRKKTFTGPDLPRVNLKKYPDLKAKLKAYTDTRLLSENAFLTLLVMWFFEAPPELQAAMMRTALADSAQEHAVVAGRWIAQKIVADAKGQATAAAQVADIMRVAVLEDASSTGGSDVPNTRKRSALLE